MRLGEVKRYEKYKDSGVEWIGEVPEGWEISKIKYQTGINLKSLSENTDEDYQIQYIDIGNVDSNGKVLDIQDMLFKDSPSRARRIISNGDTIVSTVRTYLRAITSFDKVEPNLICSTGFAVLSPRNQLLPKYLGYLMRSNYYIEEIVARSVGVSYPAINSSAIGGLECLVPPVETQKYITSFLDQKTSEIDSLIADKEKLIALLQEQRQAIISEAVTKGLDRNVKMKDSGIEWIGEVPEHWEVLPLKWIIKDFVFLLT